jgi:hypothetical protein
MLFPSDSAGQGYVHELELVEVVADQNLVVPFLRTEKAINHGLDGVRGEEKVLLRIGSEGNFLVKTCEDSTGRSRMRGFSQDFQ